MTNPMRVLYFTVVPLADASDGGRIHARTLVKRLVEDGDIELFAISAGKREWGSGTEAFFKGLSVPCEFIEFRDGTFRPEKNTIGSIVSFAVKAVFNFPWEMQALNQEHVQAAVDWAVQAWKIETIMIDYYASALFLKLPRDDVKTAIVKLNREADFYAEQIKHGQTVHGSLTSGISLWRSARFERQVDAAAGKVITIGPPDIPKHKVRSRPICITPYLDRKTERWQFSDSKSAFFIGNIQHFPNRLAIEWIATALAPVLQGLRNEIKLVIVGAVRDQVPESWRQPNLEFLGISDAATVQTLFRRTDLMLCPVENDFGLKFKAAEALSYGTPILMSEQALLGFPYLHGVKAVSLNDTQGAAKMVGELVGSANLLQSISAAQTEQHDLFVISQRGVWSKVLNDIDPPKGAGRVARYTVATASNVS